MNSYLKSILSAFQNLEDISSTEQVFNMLLKTQNTDIFIKSKKGTKKYTYIWNNEKITNDYEKKSIPYNKKNIRIREYEYIQDENLMNFLTEHLKDETNIILRFHRNKSKSYIEKELSNHDKKKLYSIIELYKNLNSNSLLPSL